jgi:hypothetical protein
MRIVTFPLAQMHRAIPRSKLPWFLYLYKEVPHLHPIWRNSPKLGVETLDSYLTGCHISYRFKRKERTQKQASKTYEKESWLQARPVKVQDATTRRLTKPTEER